MLVVLPSIRGGFTPTHVGKAISVGEIVQGGSPPRMGKAAQTPTHVGKAPLPK